MHFWTLVDAKTLLKQLTLRNQLIWERSEQESRVTGRESTREEESRVNSKGLEMLVTVIPFIVREAGKNDCSLVS